ncbi:PQQ-dependent sugar dehydrogenase [Jiulongibacter sediminis]|uniref:Glucose sorbosone dehydrogenase n=1 Tax=Jiulongibacter sediminis TaxID=1605367 RepID=A0A0P7BMF3_9BACT|nr:PQQ-dependent sugar dehydrogenase [Jiulongibacter sediminis]KPM48434.1 glucose sorbosone dehydrogenase [Jiulongibacter sediminis]
MKNLSLLFLALISMAPSCNNKPKVEYPENNNGGNLELVEAYPNLRFTRPVDFQSPNDGSNRVFVVEQEGKISFFKNDETVSETTEFLDISSKVDDNHNEEGLLGLAFHPNFRENGYFYVNYTASSSETLISRFTISSSDPNKADPGSELVLLRFDQPYGNHNGGQVAFGPDGYLYISTGDGGSGGDPKGNGQNLNTLLGAILRIDVDQTSGSKNYGIPADNPFVNRSMAQPEIYAYGLRNPWRISFDKESGRLWAADVGQNAYEEVDIIEAGKNYGWSDMEGLHTYQSGENSSEYTAPVLEISQDTGDKSITGGYVYRGTSAPSLTGQYIFADYVSGRIYALSENSDGTFSNQTLMDTRLNIASFGLDQQNELYICAFDGKIYKLKE